MTGTESIRFSVDGTAMDAAYLELTLKGRLLHERVGRWPTSATEIPSLGELVASHRGPQGTIHVIRRDDGALHLRLDGGWVYAMLAGPSPDALQELAVIVRHQLPAQPPAEDGRRAVNVMFWSAGVPQPRVSSRELEVPSWDDVAINYAPATAADLEPLMSAEPPLPGGRLVLWHGPPGTGKTNALRALTWEWRDRVATHYVTDPEVLLSDPGYLHAVLLGSAGGREQWRLIVLEDAGELLAPDAKERAGQGLARLLNLTDGLIGQGLKVIVLITGNEPLERLHPAVSRPGRCAARIEFRRFDAPQAVEWLERHDAPPVEASATLADLYALLEGRPSLAEPVFGFGRESLGAHD